MKFSDGKGQRLRLHEANDQVMSRSAGCELSVTVKLRMVLLGLQQ